MFIKLNNFTFALLISFSVKLRIPKILRLFFSSPTLYFLGPRHFHWIAINKLFSPLVLNQHSVAKTEFLALLYSKYTLQ